jgi:hypothetical protein
MENNEEEKTLTPQEKLAEFEKQKMTRRQALGRVGFLAGAAAVAALSVDDLARLAGNEMSRRATGNKAIDQVAKELKGAGVAFADTGGNPACYKRCDLQWVTRDNACTAQWGTCTQGCLGLFPPPGCQLTCDGYLDQCNASNNSTLDACNQACKPVPPPP